MRLTVLASVAVLLLAACGGDDDDSASDVEVSPFSDVQDGEFVFDADPADPSHGIFRVATTEPMICAIVWGEDESFGRFNNSLSMNGTGITDHDVVLPDVETGVTYSYVVQGTTADGKLYRSEIDTFSIDHGPSETNSDDTADLGENLAPDASVVEFSSEFSDDFAAANAIDDDTDTEWATADDGDDGFITVDLGSEQQINAVDFLTRSMADGSSITDTYTLSIDGAAPLGPFPAGTVADSQPATIDVAGRVLRFEIETSSGGNVGAVDINVFAPTN